MSRFVLTMLSVSLAAACAHANDMSMSGIGGSAIPMKSEHKSVAMRSEVVTIDLYKGYYETKVDFVFANDGAKTRVAMGFPERGMGIDGGGAGPAIQKLVSTVDGRPAPVRRVVAAHDQDTYQAYWTKDVDFGAGQTRRVQVRFRSPYGGGIRGTMAGYDFTGGNWRGKVDSSRLIVRRHSGAPALNAAWLDDHATTLSGPGAEKTHTWRNWEAQAHFTLTERAR